MPLYFCPVVSIFFILSSIFFSSPNLGGRRLDVYHTSTHGVALVRIWNAGLKCAARGSLEIQNAKNRHFGTIAQLCRAISSELRHVSTIGKNLLNSNTSSTCPHNMVNCGLTSEICWRVWGAPANFNGFRVLAALLNGTLVVGVSQTAALKRERHQYSAGLPSRWALAHISSIFMLYFLSFFPRLISAVADWMSAILPHMVWP